MPKDIEFKYTDMGMESISRNLEIFKRGTVLVGWPGNGPEHKVVEHNENKSGRVRVKVSKILSGISIAAIAMMHEFGIPSRNLPARPIMGQTNGKYGRVLPGAFRGMLLSVYKGEMSPETALKQLGVFWEGRIKVMFREGIFRPLKPATIAAKGSSMPLIDSGQLRNSVTSVVKL